MYTTLKEKSKEFRQQTINRDGELRELINALEKTSLRFRGVNESKYTMLTSLQRKVPKEMSYNPKVYMTILLSRVKADAEITGYFKRHNIPINDISCMALMQHYGLPTPLLDFSTDIEIALSFSAEELSLESENNETDGYVSLYVFDLEEEREVANHIQMMYQDGLTKARQILHDHQQQQPDTPIDASILYDIDKFVKWADIKILELAFVEYEPMPSFITLSGEKLDLKNANLSKQKGCFVLNLYNENMPLEENWNMRTNARRNRHIITHGNVQTLSFSGVHTNKPMYCYDIQKEVISRWAINHKQSLYDNSIENEALKLALKKIHSALDMEIKNANYE